MGCNHNWSDMTQVLTLTLQTNHWRSVQTGLQGLYHIDRTRKRRRLPRVLSMKSNALFVESGQRWKEIFAFAIAFVQCKCTTEGLFHTEDKANVKEVILTDVSLIRLGDLFIRKPEASSHLPCVRGPINRLVFERSECRKSCTWFGRLLSIACRSKTGMFVSIWKAQKHSLYCMFQNIHLWWFYQNVKLLMIIQQEFQKGMDVYLGRHFRGQNQNSEFCECLK